MISLRKNAVSQKRNRLEEVPTLSTDAFSN